MNAEPEPLDLSALDPSRDPERWAGVVEGTRRRVATVLREQVRAATRSRSSAGGLGRSSPPRRPSFFCSARWMRC